MESQENLLRIASGRPQIRAVAVADDESHLMVTDPATGLVWSRQDSGYSSDFEDALKFCYKLDLGGHHDWRLASERELRTIFDQQKYDRNDTGYNCEPEHLDKPVVEKLADGQVRHHTDCYTRLGIRVSSFETWSQDQWAFGFDHGKRRGIYMREAPALCVRDGR